MTPFLNFVLYLGRPQGECPNGDRDCPTTAACGVDQLGVPKCISKYKDPRTYFEPQGTLWFKGILTSIYLPFE